jgi:hypothetical protein
VTFIAISARSEDGKAGRPRGAPRHLKPEKPDQSWN